MIYNQNHKLCLSYTELVPDIMPKGTYDAAKQRGTIAVDGRGGNGNQVLIEYESLPDKYKIIIRAKYGDPYEYMAKQPIIQLVRPDAKAEEFFARYRLSNGAPLPKEPKDYVQQYTEAASWLNMIIRVLEDRTILKTLKLSKEQFWKTVCELIRIQRIDLPKSDRFIREEIKKYKLKGYESLISGKFCNSNSLKVGKTEAGEIEDDVAKKQIAIIRAAASKHQNYTATEIAIHVNPIFQANGWSQLSRSTISNIIGANKNTITPGRQGSRLYNSTIARQVVRRTTEFPLQFVSLDGWTAELLFQDAEGYDNRLVMVVVLDVMNKYPLGYAIGDRENVELIKEANRNAIQHVHELFGAYYRPWQVQSDHYGIKQMTPFFQAMSHLFTPAAVGNAKSKIIEPYFKDLNKKYCKFFPNWSGFNLTARKENQPNTEFLDKIKKTFPNRQGVEQQLHYIIEQERAAKIEEYRQQWQSMPDAVRPAILDEMQQIVVFGKQTGYLNSITGRGLCPTIEGQPLVFDSFDPAFRSLPHLKWRVTYLPGQLDKVVATSEDGKHSFLLDQTRIVGMGFMNQQEGDGAYIAQIQQYNKNRRAEIIDTYASDAAIVEEVLANTPLNLDAATETRIKLMFTNYGQQKERLQDAKKLGTKKQKALPAQQEQKDWMAMQSQYLDTKMDFNQYRD